MTKEKPLILLGIGGGVAAYKAVEVASRLTRENLDVQVQMTEAATKFITPLTFSAVTKHAVYTAMFPDAVLQTKEAIFPHLYPATEADIFAVMPATADLMAKFRAGLGGDLVTSSALALSSSCVRFFCPAMNVNMWEQSIVQENCTYLEKAGWIRLGPKSGLQACGAVGMGRMAEPEEIVAAILAALKKKQTFSCKRILILSGPTHEFLDPVRYIGNASSGRMGKALAEAALNLGAAVDFITGPVPEANLPSGTGLAVVHVTSAKEMLEKAKNLSKYSDGLLFVAAVADYTLREASKIKLPKQKKITLTLETTPDIAAAICKNKKPGQIAFGFALETHDNFTRARKKMKEKNLDAIVLNGIDSFGAEKGHFQFLQKQSTKWEDWGPLHKKDCAVRLMEKMSSFFSASSR
jgi:phosphopantothenoylcysteine decarboxylase / phosphopantothenate---cysteine ligase